jgi:hypothetical protein
MPRMNASRSFYLRTEQVVELPRSADVHQEEGAPLAAEVPASRPLPDFMILFNCSPSHSLRKV